MLDIINARKAAKTSEAHFDLIDVMLSAHDPSWSERELVSNAFIMFTAGHETTATALGWLLYYLAIKQDVQLKIKKEIDDVLKGQPITQDHLKELTYLSNTIKENLRIQPPAGFVPTRTAATDMEFEGKIIPQGSRVGVNIYAIHHDPEIWANPNEFDPDRFTKPILPFSYLPFSLKSRACLGNQFSLVEQTVFVATLLQRFKIESISSCTLPPTVEGINKLHELKVNIVKW
jgi:cytochrome P450